VLGGRGAGSLRAAFRGVGVLGVERGGWGRMLPGAALFLRRSWRLEQSICFLGGNRSGGAGRRWVAGGVGGIS
jgi:hypothetical protein